MTHIEFTIPARGLIGLRTRLMNATSGEAIMHHNFHDYQPLRGSIPARANGVMVSTETGRATRVRARQPAGARHPVRRRRRAGLRRADRRRALPRQRHGRERLPREEADQHAGVRLATRTIILKPPRQMTLELALEYIEDDELVEITPETDPAEVHGRIRLPLLLVSAKIKPKTQHVSSFRFMKAKKSGRSPLLAESRTHHRAVSVSSWFWSGLDVVLLGRCPAAPQIFRRFGRGSFR